MSWFHRHKWVNISVQKLFYSERLYGKWEYNSVREPVTTILQKCGCNEVRTIDLDGHWTFEEVNNESL